MRATQRNIKTTNSVILCLQCILICALLCCMRFDPEAIRAQIGNLMEERDQIDQTIRSLESALQSIDGVHVKQREFSEGFNPSGMTLHDAVKKACTGLIDGITRQRVIHVIERDYPFFKPKSSSVAAALVNLTKSDPPILRIAIEGRGRSPALYTTEGNTTHKLSAEESKELIGEGVTRGIGGWQSLFTSLQNSYDKAAGTVVLTPKQRAEIYNYYRYTSGGFQDKLKRIFRRSLPHLFVS